MISVKTDDEHWLRHHFTPETACHVETDPVLDDEGKTVDAHTFYINMDNSALKTEMKFTKQDIRLLEAKFKYANVLLGLALLHDDEHKSTSDSADSEGYRVQDQIRNVSQAVAPVLLPMIDQLSGLEEAEFEEMGALD